MKFLALQLAICFRSMYIAWSLPKFFALRANTTAFCLKLNLLTNCKPHCVLKVCLTRLTNPGKITSRSARTSSCLSLHEWPILNYALLNFFLKSFKPFNPYMLRKNREFFSSTGNLLEVQDTGKKKFFPSAPVPVSPISSPSPLLRISFRIISLQSPVHPRTRNSEPS